MHDLQQLDQKTLMMNNLMSLRQSQFQQIKPGGSQTVGNESNNSKRRCSAGHIPSHMNMQAAYSQNISENPIVCSVGPESEIPS